MLWLNDPNCWSDVTGSHRNWWNWWYWWNDTTGSQDDAMLKFIIY